MAPNDPPPNNQGAGGVQEAPGVTADEWQALRLEVAGLATARDVNQGEIGKLQQEAAAKDRELADLKQQLKDKVQVQIATNDNKEQKIPEFKGYADPRSASAWLDKVQQVRVTQKWSEEETIDRALQKMTQSAEEWIRTRRLLAGGGTVTAFSNWVDFSALLKKGFDNPSAKEDGSTNVAAIKQRADESCSEFWHRVERAWSEWLEDHAARMKWKVAGPDPTNPQGHDDYKMYMGVATFLKETVCPRFFANGCRTAIAQQLKSRKIELRHNNIDFLSAAQEIEQTQGGTPGTTGASRLQLTAICEDSGVAPTPALIEALTKARYPQRGGGGQGQNSRYQHNSGRQGASNGRQQQGSSDRDRLAKIQGRTKPMFCTRCKTWGKHYRNECRVPSSQISPIDTKPEQPHESQLYDSCYDGVSTMPAKLSGN